MKETVKGIVSDLEKLASKNHKKGFAHFKIEDTTALGVSMPLIRELAKKIGKDTDLALNLWNEGTHECKLLAGLVANPKTFTPENADQWVKDFYSWDVCDQAMTNLFRKTDFIWEKVVEWFDLEGEFQRRAGFAGLAVLCVHHKNEKDQRFLDCFPFIEKYASDERNFVKKSVNWALREMGKRRKNLYEPCIDLCYRLVDQDSPSAKWIASDALRELKSEKVLNRLNK